MRRNFLIHGCIPSFMVKNYTFEDIEKKVIEAYKVESAGLPGWIQDINMKIDSGKIKKTALEYWHEYRMCEYQVKNTPPGWNAEINVTYGGKPHCHAARTIDGLIETIPAKADGWLHGAFINGYFGYKMIGGSPWSKRPANSDSGARVTLRHSGDSKKTEISVVSHPDDYQLAINFAQSLVEDALSGRLKVTY